MHKIIKIAQCNGAVTLLSGACQQVGDRLKLIGAFPSPRSD